MKIIERTSARPHRLPKGWRWLKKGEHTQDGDVCCDPRIEPVTIDQSPGWVMTKDGHPVRRRIKVHSPLKRISITIDVNEVVDATTKLDAFKVTDRIFLFMLRHLRVPDHAAVVRSQIRSYRKTKKGTWI
jgi:hypothetical protein